MVRAPIRLRGIFILGLHVVDSILDQQDPLIRSCHLGHAIIIGLSITFLVYLLMWNDWVFCTGNITS